MATLAQKITAAIEGPSGASRDEILAFTGHKYTCVDAKLPKLVDRGQIVKVKVLGKRLRYFTNQALADAWAATQTPVDAVEVQIRAAIAAAPEAGHSARSIWRQAQHFGKDTISRAMYRMRVSGELVGVQCGARGLLHFQIHEAAEKFKALHTSAQKEKKPAGTKLTAAKARASIKRERPKDTRETITPPHVMVQRVGAIVVGDTRYQVQPGDHVPSIFRKLPLGATLYGMSA